MGFNDDVKKMESFGTLDCLGHRILCAHTSKIGRFLRMQVALRAKRQAHVSSKCNVVSYLEVQEMRWSELQVVNDSLIYSYCSCIFVMFH